MVWLKKKYQIIWNKKEVFNSCLPHPFLTEKGSLDFPGGKWSLGCCSVAQSYLTLWLHGLQHARLPCPSPSPRVCPSSCPSSRWCHPTNSSSVTPFSSCPQSFPASGSCPVSRLITSGGQSIGALASAPVLSMNIQGSFPLGFKKLTSWHLVPSLHGKWMGKQWKQWQTLFWGLQNHCRWWPQPWN